MRKQPQPTLGAPPTIEKGPLDTDPIQNSSNPPQGYSAAEEFPSWDPESLAYTVQWMLQEALNAQPGAWALIPVVEPPPGVIAIDFDGTGGILINPVTMMTPKGQDLAKALGLVLGQLVRIGTWEAA